MCIKKAIIFMIADGFSYKEIQEKLKVTIYQIRYILEQLYEYLMIDGNMKYKSRLLPIYSEQIREYING